MLLPARPEVVPPSADPAAAAAAGDRRRHHRVPGRLVVLFNRLAPGADEEPGLTEDASAGGLFIATERPLPRGARVGVELFCEDSPEPAVRARAVVRWRRRWRHPRGMGVEIVAISESDRERLERWLERLASGGGEAAAGEECA